jgi:hypothetical protein
MNLIQKIIDTIDKISEYKEINKYSDVKLRYKKDGISTKDAIYYRLSYCKEQATKDGITAKYNLINNKLIRRQSFDDKESNIPLKTYELLLESITALHNDECINSDNNSRFVGVDGVYNLNGDFLVNLNLGLYDVIHCVPLDLTLFGNDFRNNEISAFKKIIIDNMDKLKNCIFICDRLYHCYELLDFLQSNNLKFIIRAKGKANPLDKSIPLNKKKVNPNNFKLANKLRPHLRIIRTNFVHTKTVPIYKKKRRIGSHELLVNSDYVLITNLVNDNIYTDDFIFSAYKKRWNIEIFFKFLKNNFKFNEIIDDSIIDQKKMYICEMILTYIMKIIEYDYWLSNKPPSNTITKYDKKTKTTTTVTATAKINESQLIKGIFDEILYDLIKGTLDHSKYNNFCKTYIKIAKNEINRKCIRIARSPYKKWSLQGLNRTSKMIKVINAIKLNKTHKLTKELQLIVKTVIKINGKEYG